MSECKCEICNKYFKSLIALSKHLKSHTVTSQEYYDKYLAKNNDGICKICANSTRSLGLNGYKATCSSKCGSIVSAQTRKNNCLTKYGVENISQVPEIKHKISKSVKSEKCQMQTKQTVRLRYGVDYVNQSELVKKNKTHNNNLELAHMHRNAWADLYEKDHNCTRIGKLINKYGQGWLAIKSKCHTIREKGYTFIDNTDLVLIENYDKCQSKPEKELYEFITSYSDALWHNRNVLKPYELDIYLPELKLAIEYNGCYFHSIEHGMSKDYHLKKSLICREKGIRLIHIYEFEDIEHQKQLLKDLILGIDNYHKKDFNKNNLVAKIPKPELIHTTNRGYHIYGAGNLIGGNIL